MSWEYKIKEIDQFHFEIEYKYFGYFGKLKNTIVQSASIIQPLNAFYTIERSKYLIIYSDIWQFISEDLFGFKRNKGDHHYSKIISHLKEAVHFLENSRKKLESTHKNFIKVELLRKDILFKKYVRLEDINEGLINHSSFFIDKIKKGFLDTKNIAEEEIYQIVTKLLIEIETLEFKRKYNEESDLYSKYWNCLYKLEKEKNFLSLFFEEEQEYLADIKRYKHIYFKPSKKKIPKEDLPKRNFLLLCNQPLGPIIEDTTLKLKNKIEDTILSYEFSVLRHETIHHAYSLNEKFCVERVTENGIIQQDAFTVLFHNFRHFNLNHIPWIDIHGLSFYTYQLVHQEWSYINNFIDSYNIRLRGNRHLPSISYDGDIYFLISNDHNPLFNNRLLNLKLSESKTTFVPDYSCEESYCYEAIQNYCFLDGNIIRSDLYADSAIDGEIIFNVNEFKQRLTSKIKDKMSYDNILKRLQQKIPADWHYGEKPALFSLELAKNELSGLFEKNKQSFLYVENKIYFLHFFLNDLFNKNISDYTKDRQIHQFVISKTKEADNPEFGRLAEKEVHSFLINHYNNLKWSGKFSVPVEFSPAFKFEITWHNQHNESFLPYDISIRSQLFEIKVDVKATRGSEDNIFYVSIPELKKVLENPNLYLIARVSMIEEEKKMRGIRLNSEMNLNFFQFKNETIEIIKSNLTEWEGYYSEKSVRFLTSHFEQSIPNIPIELNLSEKFEQYQNSCHAVIRSYFQNKIDQDQETKWLLSKTQHCSWITEDPALQLYFDSFKKVAIDQLFNRFSPQLKDYKMGMAE